MCEVVRRKPFSTRLIDDDVFREGYNAAEGGKEWTDCPYKNTTDKHRRRVCSSERLSWIEGFSYCVTQANSKQG